MDKFDQLVRTERSGEWNATILVCDRRAEAVTVLVYAWSRFLEDENLKRSM